MRGADLKGGKARLDIDDWVGVIGSGRQHNAQGITQGVSCIGRHDQSLDSRTGRLYRGGRGRRRLTDTTLAGKEHDSHEMSERRPKISARFFSSFSAVSMMTFSALRLSIPSMGILTSTASR